MWQPKPWYVKERDPKIDTEPQKNRIAVFDKDGRYLILAGDSDVKLAADARAA